MLVLDANILVRAVLGKRVRGILDKHAGETRFFAPDSAFAEARKHLPRILLKRRIAPDLSLTVLEALGAIVETVGAEMYAPLEQVARRRLKGRDEDDWPVLATALLLGCPVWTEDADFFGTGVATWTSDRVELFLAEARN